MSKVGPFSAQPLPKNIDPQTIAALEQMLQELERVVGEMKAVADDHETRITALEP